MHDLLNKEVIIFMVIIIAFMTGVIAMLMNLISKIIVISVMAFYELARQYALGYVPEETIQYVESIIKKIFPFIKKRNGE